MGGLVNGSLQNGKGHNACLYFCCIQKIWASKNVDVEFCQELKSIVFNCKYYKKLVKIFFRWSLDSSWHALCISLGQV